MKCIARRSSRSSRAARAVPERADPRAQGRLRLVPRAVGWRRARRVRSARSRPRAGAIRLPPAAGRARLCISDFFRPKESGEIDVLGLTCVTMGPEVSRRAKQLFEADEYSEYLFLHGFGVECAEALAEMWHKRMRMELGISGEDSPRIRELFQQRYRGSRYSFGYPACPDLAEQAKLWRLLRPERIGCTLRRHLADRAGAVDHGHHRAPPGGEVLHGLRGDPPFRMGRASCWAHGLRRLPEDRLELAPGRALDRA